MRKKLLVLTGGGDCPGLNAVIRAIVKSAEEFGGWDVWGSIEAFNGVLADPVNIIPLKSDDVAGIHVKGGTIIKTTNRGNPLKFPIQNEDGSWGIKDLSQDLVNVVKDLDFDAVINIGGDGSQKISYALFKKGMPIIGVPKTIDNDLGATDFTFGFSTAVQTATDSFDKLVSTAESHHRVMIMEVMGRDAGWIALHTAIAGGAEICLIPEIPFNYEVVLNQIHKRYNKGKGFVNMVVAEGAKAIDGKVVGGRSKEKGDEHIKLGGIANTLRSTLETMGCEAQIRCTILGHTQRGGSPIAFDRILATAYGAKAFEMAHQGHFGKLVTYKNNNLSMSNLEEAVKDYKFVDQDHYLIQTARSLGISFGEL